MLFTCAETRRDMIIWSAVSFRILLQGSTRSPSQGSTTGPVNGPEGAGAAEDATAGDADAEAAGGAGTAGRSRNWSTSDFVTRPEDPVPWIVPRSRPCSATIFRTSGVDLR